MSHSASANRSPATPSAEIKEVSWHELIQDVLDEKKPFADIPFRVRLLKTLSADDVAILDIWYAKISAEDKPSRGGQFFMGAVLKNIRGKTTGVKDSAEYYYTQAAGAGYAGAQTSLGNMILDGKVSFILTGDRAMATKWAIFYFEQANAQHHPHALYGFSRIASRYSARCDYEKARDFYIKSRTPTNKVNLGMLYATGRVDKGDPQSDRMAAKLYREGIEGGCHDGARLLLDLLAGPMTNLFSANPLSVISWNLSRRIKPYDFDPSVTYYAVTAFTPLCLAKRENLPPLVIEAFDQITKDKTKSEVFLNLLLSHQNPDEMVFSLLPAAAVAIILKLRAGERIESAAGSAAPAASRAAAAAPSAVAVVVRAPTVKYSAAVLPPASSLWQPLLADGYRHEGSRGGAAASAAPRLRLGGTTESVS